MEVCDVNTSLSLNFTSFCFDEYFGKKRKWIRTFLEKSSTEQQIKLSQT